MSGSDTITKSQKCHFEKIKDDTLSSTRFHLKTIFKDNEESEVLYDGNDLVSTYSKDSSGTIQSKTLWPKEVKSAVRSSRLYAPFIKAEKSVLPDDSKMNNPNYILKFINEESINGDVCYHVQMNEKPQNDSLDELQTFKIEYHYWVKKEDSVPVQISTAYSNVMNNDSMYQYEIISLKNYKLNIKIDHSVFTLKSLPEHIKIRDYVPYEDVELLPNDTIAPNWELTSLNDEKINLTDLKGSLVLVDFFYKSCYYCMLALPGLQELHQQYKDKGLKIVGINPFDEKEKGIVPFLEKRGVTFTVLLGGLETAKEYHVTAYPTVYLIDKTGKIIFSQIGFTEELHKKLEQVIKDNL